MEVLKDELKKRLDNTEKYKEEPLPYLKPDKHLMTKTYGYLKKLKKRKPPIKNVIKYMAPDAEDED